MNELIEVWVHSMQTVCVDQSGTDAYQESYEGKQVHSSWFIF